MKEDDQEKGHKRSFSSIISVFLIYFSTFNHKVKIHNN